MSELPTVIAACNLFAAIFVFAGWLSVKKLGRPDWHERLMLTAIGASAAFLAVYLYYHAQVGSVPYPRHDWTRPIYFIILIPHVILAGVMAPFIALAVWYAYRQRYRSHTRITRWLWVVWLYVSVTGVLVYVMLYRL